MSLNLINLNQLSRECNGIGGLLTFNEPLRQIFVAQFLMESLYFSFLKDCCTVSASDLYVWK